MSTDYNKFFDSEIKEKKAQVALLRSKTGARGGSSSRKGMRTPSDFLSRQEKKKLNGEVRTYNMNSLMDWKSFNEKAEDEKKRLLTHWRNIYDNKQIMEALSEGRPTKLNSQSFADIVNGLGIPKKHRVNSGEKKPRQSKAVAIAQPKEQEPPKLSLLEFAEQIPPEPKPEPQKLITKGLHFEYNGDYKQDQINRILTKLQLMLEDEPNKFTVSISITERA